MKSKYFIYAALLAVALMNGGCVTIKSMPSFARAQPEESMIVLHPDRMEDEGGVVVTFTGALPLVEV